MDAVKRRKIKEEREEEENKGTREWMLWEKKGNRKDERKSKRLERGNEKN